MAKTGLGKGLGALLGGNKPADPPASTDDEDTPVSIQPDGEVEKVVRMPINDVEPCQSQPRKDFDQQALEDLALSITANGIIQPLVVRSSDTGKHQLIAGERRWRAARIAGLTRAKDMVMLGKRIPAEQAKDWGIITEVADDGDGLTELIHDYAAKLNALAPISLQSLKRVLNSAYDTSLKVALDVEGHSYEKIRSTEDYLEGINAFAEKRKPVYKGR